MQRCGCARPCRTSGGSRSSDRAAAGAREERLTSARLELTAEAQLDATSGSSSASRAAANSTSAAAAPTRCSRVPRSWARSNSPRKSSASNTTAGAAITRAASSDDGASSHPSHEVRAVRAQDERAARSAPRELGRQRWPRSSRGSFAARTPRKRTSTAPRISTWGSPSASGSAARPTSRRRGPRRSSRTGDAIEQLRVAAPRAAAPTSTQRASMRVAASSAASGRQPGSASARSMRTRRRAAEPERAQAREEHRGGAIGAGELAPGRGGNRHAVAVELAEQALRGQPASPDRRIHDLHSVRGAATRRRSASAAADTDDAIAGSAAASGSSR